MDDEGSLTCVGISGYWAGENGTPWIENSPMFQNVRSALEWGESRARIVLIRVSVKDGPTYYSGDPYEDPGTSYLPLNLDDAEESFANILGRIVSQIEPTRGRVRCGPGPGVRDTHHCQRFEGAEIPSESLSDRTVSFSQPVQR